MRVLVVALGEPLEKHHRVALGRPVAEADERQPADRLIGVGVGERVQKRPDRVDRAGRVTREQLERDEGGAAARRARVLEPAPEQLELLAEPELADRAIGDGPLLVVGAARSCLELVGPLRAHLGEITLGSALGQLVGRRRGLGEGQLATGAPATSSSRRLAGPT